MIDRKLKNKRLLLELGLSAAVFFALVATLAEFDTFEAFYEFSRDHEDYELDDVFAALLALPAILLVFVIRRLTDLRREAYLRNKAEDVVRHLAATDPLTGLANRLHFFAEIQERLKEKASTDARFALFHLDLDRFKQINDRFGPTAGDNILKQVSGLLEEQLRDGEQLARVGGDEFLLLTQYTRKGEITERASTLIKTIDRNFCHRGIDHAVSASIGIALCENADTGRTTGAESLLTNADIALYAAKTNGRNRYEIYNPTMRRDFEERTVLAEELQRACRKREFTAFYQPIVDAKTFQIVGAEALVRWNHPEKGILPPVAFLEMAETMGLLAEIDQQMFEEALTLRRNLKKGGATPPRISINISADRLKSPLFLHAIRNAGIERDALIFEISEAVIFENLDDMSRFNLEALVTDQGIEVEIDDFGSGRASILSLLEMKPSRLKIDRNLTAPIVESEGSRRLIKSVVDMAAALGIDVVGEGVETLDHARILADQGCSLLQGYYFAKPMPAEDFQRFLKAHLETASGISRISA